MSRSTWTLEQIVDLRHYPITDLESPAGRALVDTCRSRFKDGVLCELEAFLRPEAVQAVITQVEACREHAFLSSRRRTAYSAYAPIHDEAPATFEEDSAYAKVFRRHCYYLAFDEFGSGSVLPVLYKNEQFSKFVAAALNVPALYPSADPLMGAPVSLHTPGSEIGWHCDTQEYTVTVMFRTSDEGGIFQYVPQTGPRDVNYPRVPDLFDGDESLIRSIPIRPGSIVLFRGANTLHRVTPTGGSSYRILSPFHFEQVPGRIYSDEFKRDSFGRTESRV